MKQNAPFCQIYHEKRLYNQQFVVGCPPCQLPQIQMQRFKFRFSFSHLRSKSEPEVKLGSQNGKTK
jgi:hypothetical protein